MVTYLGSLVQLCCGKGGTLQTNITGVCGECSQCLSHTGFAPTHGMCAFPGYTSQVWVALQELSEAGPGLHALPRSKQLKFRFSGTPQRRRFSWFQYFVPFPVPSSSSDSCLASAVPPSWGCDLSPPPFLPLSFLGVQQANLLRCAVCLFWGADLWL